MPSRIVGRDRHVQARIEQGLRSMMSDGSIGIVFDHFEERNLGGVTNEYDAILGLAADHGSGRRSGLDDFCTALCKQRHDLFRIRIEPRLAVVMGIEPQ